MLAGFLQIRQALLEQAAQAGTERAKQKFLGEWDLLDVLAHLRGWDFTNLQAAQSILQGVLPSFYSQYDRDWTSFNAHLVSAHRQDTLAASLEAVRASQAQLLVYLEQLEPRQLFTDQGVRHGRYKVIISRLIEAEMRDERRHLDQIRRFISAIPKDSA